MVRHVTQSTLLIRESLWNDFESRAARDPDGVFCRLEGETMTLGELRDRAAELSGGLRALGVGEGSHVATMLPNSIDHIALIFATLRIGAVFVPLNVRAKGPGLAHILGQAAPVVLVADSSVREPIDRAATDSGWDGRVLWLDAGVRLTSLLPTAASPGSPSPQPELVSISYTSGTTGPPKGVLLTDAMLRSCVRGVATATGRRDGDVYYVWEPFFHLGGLQMLFLASLTEVILEVRSRFSASRFWDDVVACGADHIHYLGGVLQILLRQPPAAHDRAHRVRTAWGAGAAEEIWREFEERFGIPLREVYGLTESSSINTVNATSRVGSIGRAVEEFEVEIVDEHGMPLDPGERGEIRVRPRAGGSVTPGYYLNPEATARLLRDDGWLYTGDRGHADADGYLHFLGRITDNVRVGGENVSAWEVESVVRGHPGVGDCAVVGVKGEIGEQDIVLFVARAADSDVTESDLVAHCRAELAPYQVPRYIAWVDGFVRGPSMRIQKELLPRDTSAMWDRMREQR